MTQVKHGLQVFDESGALLIEVGAHVISENAEFAKELGIISAYWAQAEINLNCLFAVLLNTTPEKAAEQLKSKEHNSAFKVFLAAKKIAKEHLTKVELGLVINILDQFDVIRKRRNRIQHDMWAKKGDDNGKMFCVHSNQYLEFTTQFIEVSKKMFSDKEKNEQLIGLAGQFACSIEIGYAISDLQELILDIDQLSRSLVGIMFTLISQRIATPLSVN